MTPILECQSLTKKYGRLNALDNINLSLYRGRIVGLLGPNGSGKTTLIKLINGLITPTDGNILVDGMPLDHETKHHISYLPDHTYLSMSSRVEQVIAMFEDFYPDFDSRRAYELLADLGISPTSRLQSMSKGTKEKVQLILVMSRRAKLYILDEPIAGVDPAARDYILNTIMQNYNPEATVLISTHLIADIENILHDVIFIKQGRIELYQPADKLREQSGQSVDAVFREVFKC